MTQTRSSLLAGAGQFEDVTSIMTLINQRRHTGTLHVSGVSGGYLHYDQGQIVHAEAGHDHGEAALHTIMRGTLMQEVRYEFFKDEGVSTRTINKDHDTLLFGLAKVLDENEERERRILNEDPSALALNADPNVIDTLALFRDTLDTDALFVDELPTPPAMMPDMFWEAVKDATKDVVGPAGPTVMTVVARQARYQRTEKGFTVPADDAQSFIQRIIDKVLPDLRPALASRLQEVKQQF